MGRLMDPEFVYKLNRLVPERKLNMKLLTRLTNPQLSILLENTDCLKNESPEIKVDAEIAEKAVKPIKKMLEISAKLGL